MLAIKRQVNRFSGNEQFNDFVPSLVLDDTLMTSDGAGNPQPPANFKLKTEQQSIIELPKKTSSFICDLVFDELFSPGIGGLVISSSKEKTIDLQKTSILTDYIVFSAQMSNHTLRPIPLSGQYTVITTQQQPTTQPIGYTSVSSFQHAASFSYTTPVIYEQPALQQSATLLYSTENYALFDYSTLNQPQLYTTQYTAVLPADTTLTTLPELAAVEVYSPLSSSLHDSRDRLEHYRRRYKRNFEDNEQTYSAQPFFFDSQPEILSNDSDFMTTLGSYRPLTQETKEIKPLESMVFHTEGNLAYKPEISYEFTQPKTSYKLDNKAEFDNKVTDLHENLSQNESITGYDTLELVSPEQNQELRSTRSIIDTETESYVSPVIIEPDKKRKSETISRNNLAEELGIKKPEYDENSLQQNLGIIYPEQPPYKKEECESASECFAPVLDWMEGKKVNYTDKEMKSLSECYAEDIKNLKKAREIIKRRGEIGFADGYHKLNPEVRLTDYKRNGKVQKGFKLADEIYVDKTIKDTIYTIRAYDSKKGEMKNIGVRADSVYAVADKKSKGTILWEYQEFVDTDTGKIIQGLYAADIAELKQEARKKLGNKDKHGMRLNGMIMLINGEEPGQGTITLHDYKVKAGDKIEIVYKNDAARYQPMKK